MVTRRGWSEWAFAVQVSPSSVGVAVFTRAWWVHMMAPVTQCLVECLESSLLCRLVPCRASLFLLCRLVPCRASLLDLFGTALGTHKVRYSALSPGVTFAKGRELSAYWRAWHCTTHRLLLGGGGLRYHTPLFTASSCDNSKNKLLFDSSLLEIFRMWVEKPRSSTMKENPFPHRVRHHLPYR